jgi:macrolide-specific efflux system membrane fusion protein
MPGETHSTARAALKRAVWTMVVTLMAVGLGDVWLTSRAGPSAAGPPRQTTTVALGDIEQVVSALGNLQPRDFVDVGLQVSGQVRALHVAIGDRVEVGTLLAEIDPAVLNATVEGGRAQLAMMRAQRAERLVQRELYELQRDRQRRLHRANATTEEALQLAEANVRTNAAQIDQLEAQIRQAESKLRADETTLGYARVVAPMAGTIVQLLARRGQTFNAVQQSPVLMRVADLSTMTVYAQVSEADVPRLRIGMPAYFRILGMPGRRWTGRLAQVQPSPETVNNVVLYTALFDVANPGGELMMQMTAQAFFVLAEARGVPVVPLAALRAVPPSEGGPATRRVERVGTDGAVTEGLVEIGVTSRTHAEVRSGLALGDRIALPSPPAAPARAGGARR